MIKREELYIRDPFVVPDEEDEVYYLFGTTDKNCWNEEKATGFDYYTSVDLENFEGPFPAFRPPEDFWADRNFWAPEVHFYNDKYYIFATFITDGVKRGTQALCSKEINGLYKPHSEGRLTPDNWQCLDGTFYVDKKGDPWMIFCHEWVEVYDGKICAVKLTEDLKSTAGEVITLFSASEASWTKSIRVVDGRDCFVTDGPFLYETNNESLIMIWSSFIENNIYAISTAYSQSGNIKGPWQLADKPLYADDAGHGMIFKTFEGQLMLAIHTPNERGRERPIFIELNEKNEKLHVK